jgi:ABC-type dipeptide/oligopeptide/nickel transport system permease component
MTSHLLRRIGGTILVLLAVSFVIFAALDVTPGDAAEALVGDSASQEQLDALRHEMGLDVPLAQRYLGFLTDLFTQGDLGQSLVSGRQVSDLLSQRLPPTLLLAVTATALATIAGVTIGIVAAVRAGSFLDTAIMGGTALGLAVPTFWSSLLLVMLFSLHLGWLPVVGAGSPKHLLLPALTLALPTTAVVARLMRSSVLEQLSADYVRTAHAKGATPRRVMTYHVLRNSLIPLVMLLGLYLGRLLGGAFIVETIFGWPGLGRLTVQAIFDRDQPVVMGAALTVATIYLIINFVVDLLHAWLDPRVAHETL